MTTPCISLKRPFMSGLKVHSGEADLAVSLPVGILLCTVRNLCSVWSKAGKMPLLPWAMARGMVQAEISWR